MWMAVLKYVVKHVVAAMAVVCTNVALTVISYFGLFLWAMLTNAQLGSPVALPFWLLVAFLLSIVAVLAVLWPVTSISEVVCRYIGHWHPLTQIPLATVLLFVEVVSLGILYAFLWKQPVTRSILDGAIAGLILLIPLGIYWWSLQATDWILDKCCLFWRWFWKRGDNRAYAGNAG